MKKDILLSCLYPNKCAACGEIIDEGKTLCDYCSITINNNNLKDVCLKCGLARDNCCCKYREYRFKGIVAAYKNDGLAKKVYYSYKLGKREELARFFADSATRAVKMAFGDLKFDALCCVPTSLRSLLKNGFDHNNTIASYISDNLDVPYLRGFLKVHALRKPQHKSLFRQRLENVRGKYYTVNRIKVKRVLLFDDIYTTGATLDEASKELMFAGAQEVYCVSVLATKPKKKTDGVKGNDNRYRH